MIIDSWAFVSFDAVCVDSPVIIILFYKKGNRQVRKNWNFQWSLLKLKSPIFCVLVCSTAQEVVKIPFDYFLYTLEQINDSVKSTQKILEFS